MTPSPDPAQPTQPGRQAGMNPPPETAPRYAGSGRLQGKVALVTGGDSGIGRAVSVLFAREGAIVAIVHLEEDDDARETVRQFEAEGARALTLRGDIGDEAFCAKCVAETMAEFGRLDVLVSNAAEQHVAGTLEDLAPDAMSATFRTNVFGPILLARAASPHLREGASLIVTTSVTAYRGSKDLVDYAATKGALVAFVRSLASQWVERGIRVNGVAPGPIWTPLIPASFSSERIEKFGRDVPMKRPGQPSKVAPSFLFLACEDSSYMTGQVLHPNGGEPVGS